MLDINRMKRHVGGDPAAAKMPMMAKPAMKPPKPKAAKRKRIGFKEMQ
jgi:hypothetical protein